MILFNQASVLSNLMMSFTYSNETLFQTRQVKNTSGESSYAGAEVKRYVLILNIRHLSIRCQFVAEEAWMAVIDLKYLSQ